MSPRQAPRRASKAKPKASTRRKAKPAAKLPSLPVVVSLAQLAAITGHGENTLARWVDEGLPAKRGRQGQAAKVDLQEGLAWILAREREPLVARITELLTSPDEKAAKARKEQALAEWHELRVRKAKGEVIAFDAVEATWCSIAATVREGVLALPGLAVQEGLLEPGAVPALDALCRDALMSLSGQRTAELANDRVEAAEGGEDEADAGSGD